MRDNADGFSRRTVTSVTSGLPIQEMSHMKSSHTKTVLQSKKFAGIITVDNQSEKVAMENNYNRVSRSYPDSLNKGFQSGKPA
jgi:hypothetical protein